MIKKNSQNYVEELIYIALFTSKSLQSLPDRDRETGIFRNNLQGCDVLYDSRPPWNRGSFGSPRNIKQDSNIPRRPRSEERAIGYAVNFTLRRT